ncbi:MAG: co-chaperone GroES [Candidatus Daviesbacteria bacterium]|nr:co-chaperone GroES [Candidatus Daviesbacteria bacterium]
MARIKSDSSTKISIKPLMGYVLVQPSEAENKTASGIILPESAQEKPAQGVVLSCGDEMVLENGKTLKCPVKVGDKVVYKKWGGDEIKVDGKELKLVKFDDLMAILE